MLGDDAAEVASSEMSAPHVVAVHKLSGGDKINGAGSAQASEAADAMDVDSPPTEVY